VGDLQPFCFCAGLAHYDVPASYQSAGIQHLFDSLRVCVPRRQCSGPRRFPHETLRACSAGRCHPFCVLHSLFAGALDAGKHSDLGALRGTGCGGAPQHVTYAVDGRTPDHLLRVGQLPYILPALFAVNEQDLQGFEVPATVAAADASPTLIARLGNASPFLKMVSTASTVIEVHVAPQSSVPAYF